MGTLGSKLILPTVLIFALGGLSCARSNNGPDEVEGTQHSGGGLVAASKPEDVNSTLDLAIRLATEPDEQKNIFVQFWKSVSQKSNSVSGLTVIHLFPNGEGSVVQQRFRFESASLRAFKENKLTRLPTGDCPQSISGKHADASVSDLKINAEICFSIGNLSRTPPSVLLRELLSLVLHEAVHMGGAEEDEAVAWQNAFSTYFGERFGDITTDTVTAPTFKSLSEIRVLLGQAINIATRDQSNVRAFAVIGKMNERIAALPYFDDPLALELKTHPKYSVLIDNYSNAVFALIEKIQNEFFVQPELNLKFPFVRHIPLDIPPVHVVETLKQIGNDIDNITENFIAFTEGGGDVRSTCHLPTTTVEVPGKPDSASNQRVFGPSQICAPAEVY